ncbi:MAG: xanthine dehydrogenase family protein molybdopterin-binding subunit, partial [Pseudohongiellaceae bacterium]
APGVLAVYTCKDLKDDGIGDVPCLAPAQNRDGTVCYMPPRPALASERVRFAGDPVVMVVAETPEQARDAAELVFVDYEQMDAVVDTASALAASATVWHQAANNRCFDWQSGDPEATQKALDSAARVITLDLVNNRVVPNSMETRGIIADTDDAGRLVLHASCQGVHVLRRILASQIFHCDEKDIHVLCHDVGGGFGMKIFVYPEYVTAMFAARKLGRPVKWVSDRSEAFLSDCHGRDNLTTLHLALDSESRILGLKVDTIANLGAYLSNFSPFVATAAGVPMLVGCYDIPAAYARVQGVFTNTAPVDAYRGAGRPEAIYAIERLLDVAAGEVGLSPLEIRRRNFIRPEQMPYATALGSTYDSGNFVKNMEDAAVAADWAGFEVRRAEAKARSKLRGIGVASYIERCAGGAAEDARLTVDASGHVTLYIGTQSNGQGHETAFRQILCERLGLSFEDISMVQGDSDRIATGGGTMGSRSVPVGGSAVSACAIKLMNKMKQSAADLLEAALVDIEFSGGEFRIVGTDRRYSFSDVAKASAPTDGSASFDEIAGFAPDNATYPNGTHICELEVDADTGVVQIIKFTVVDDFGKVINPQLLAGQVHGGIGQGLGQALLELCVYESDSGQLLSASFQDYAMPRADDVPNIDFSLNEVPCLTNPLGIKGAGEAGAIGAPPAIINALVDALREYKVRHLDMPATAHSIWNLMQK